MWWGALGLVCSTPFGITDEVTAAALADPAPADECSTPFGITDEVTHQPLQQPRVLNVLNAFRHHG